MPTNPQPAGNATGSVLVVDSCERSRLSIGLVVSEVRVDFATVADGFAAWTLLLKGTIALVITDLELAGMSGMELLRQMRATGPTAHIPVVVITRDCRVSVIREAFDAGAAEFLVKPVTPLLLRRVVQRLLGINSGANETADAAFPFFVRP